MTSHSRNRKVSMMHRPLQQIPDLALISHWQPKNCSLDFRSLYLCGAVDKTDHLQLFEPGSSGWHLERKVCLGLLGNQLSPHLPFLASWLVLGEWELLFLQFLPAVSSLWAACCSCTCWAAGSSILCKFTPQVDYLPLWELSNLPLPIRFRFYWTRLMMKISSIL